jgi:hypothetical protein
VIAAAGEERDQRRDQHDEAEKRHTNILMGEIARSG